MKYKGAKEGYDPKELRGFLDVNMAGPTHTLSKSERQDRYAKKKAKRGKIHKKRNHGRSV